MGLDDELKDPTQWNVVRSDGAGDTIANELLRGELKDTIKCVTCHDVHKQGLHVAANKSELPTGSRYTMPHLQDIDGIEFQLAYHPETEPPTFVDWSLKYGALCITCHIK